MNPKLLLSAVMMLFLSTLSAQSKPLPDVDLLKLDSITVIKSRDIITPGKPTVLVVWNSMMRPAFAELDSLAKVFPAWSAKYGVELVTVASQYSPKLDNLGKFLVKHPYTFPIYRESDRKFANTMGINAMPATYFIDKKGMIVDQIIGFSPGDEKKIEEKIMALVKG